MSLKLYYAPKTRSTRPRWLLEEMGLLHELVRVDPKSKPAGYAELHPLQHVPVLLDGDTAVFESAAICLYLADKDEGHRFAPKPGTTERAHYYQWMFYGMTELEPQLVVCSAEARKPEGERNQHLYDLAKAHAAKALAPLEQLLAHGDYLVDGRFTAADAILGSLVEWARALKLTEGLPKVTAYAERLHRRPAAVRARAD